MMEWTCFNNEEFYDNYWKNHRWNFDRDYQILIDMIKEIKPGSIMEVGCGNARNLRSIQRFFPDIKLFGIDIAESSISFMNTFLGELWVDDIRKYRKRTDLVLSFCTFMTMPYILNDSFRNIARNTDKLLLFEPFFCMQNLWGKYRIFKREFARGIPFFVIDNGFKIKKFIRTDIGKTKIRIGMLYAEKEKKVE